jgi:tetratricopeptide (TPR) repeat protein
MYVMAYVKFAQNRNLRKLNNELLEVYRLDTTRLDVMQELAKSYYYLRDFERAWFYYSRFNRICEEAGLSIYNFENAKIGLVYAEMGEEAEAEKYFSFYKDFVDDDNSIYKNLSLAVYYSYHGNKEKALEMFRLFSDEENYHYWILLFLEIDPLVDNIKDLPEFKNIMEVLRNKFWLHHDEIRSGLSADGLI